MDGIEVPSYEREEIVPATDVQIRAMLAKAANTPMPAIWYLYALLGLRRGEGFGVRTQDISLKQRTITIAQQIQAIRGNLAIVKPKNRKIRILPLPSAAIPLVEERLSQVQTAKEKAGESWIDNDLLFCGPIGAPLWPTTIDHWWRELRTASEFPASLTLHSLRHSFATLLDEVMISEATKGQIMGHAKKNIAQRYTHPRLRPCAVQSKKSLLGS